MPEVSRFFGIKVKMVFGDHAPPHFHAEYGEDAAVINIQALTIIGGRRQTPMLGMVIERSSQRQGSP